MRSTAEGGDAEGIVLDGAEHRATMRTPSERSQLQTPTSAETETETESESESASETESVRKQSQWLRNRKDKLGT